MSSFICKIKCLTKVPLKAIILTQPLFDTWSCSQRQSIKISVGKKTLIARVIHLPSKEHAVYIHPTLAQQLALPPIKELRVHYSDRHLRFGPVIAILTTGYTGSFDKPFGNRSNLFRSFLLASRQEHPIFYVFSPEMVDWNTNTTTGWFYYKKSNGDYGWSRRTAPLPDVIYERIPNRKAESLPQVQSCLKRLKELGACPVFNQGFFSKWSIHEILYQQSKTSYFIPETYISPTIELVRYMVDKHKMVYLKPNGGSLGLGILRITKNKKNGYFCRFRTGDRNILRKFSSINNLIEHHFGHQKQRFNQYLIQQGIRLVRYHDRPVDFRVHMNKDRQGRWQVVGIGSKVAGFGSVTTHTRTGGSIVSTEQLLTDIFQSQAALAEKAIKQASIIIAETMEQYIDGPIGELGLDIGIDCNHHVWLFEVNAKPGRHIFVHPSLKAAGFQSARMITEYSLKLTNFV
ncbi:YheC/YheD family protein [Mechercharimyces sp. CAU 1602]|uniref:YheC/YheD family endospore coat-associated protein n=1 Tax=Mechercharimyces sp. CAU 1602 TaxID=2973933 RepID=UPI002162BB23|nr:YheC/YheD family protein [Mechercharimyces sp. CAU 1602]MCS1351633.1 YheC/YheD family protein [Mechercharimyces sp. CAU 1602]